MTSFDLMNVCAGCGKVRGSEAREGSLLFDGLESSPNRRCGGHSCGRPGVLGLLLCLFRRSSRPNAMSDSVHHGMASHVSIPRTSTRIQVERYVLVV